MSRRAPAAAGPDRAEANRATLKQLVKLEANKTCADCKRNKHPRWASWNLGVFVCIRCSGIHRGMGTHVSRVKSVDLDSWTDEQLASMVRWGNARANRYWEHKLAEAHVPNEAKIENFIRTKYDSRRWVMDGPVPDPATLDDGGDDDLPLKVVQERARSASGAAAAARNGTAPLPQPPGPRPQMVDLFGDMSEPAPAPRSSTVEPAATRVAGLTKAPAAPPKQARPGESLLGLDFFGGAQTGTPARPASTGPSVSGAAHGRTDLKQSILSLYASKPAVAPVSVQQQQNNLGAMGDMQSPPMTSSNLPQSNTQSLSGLGDAFGSLSFASPQQTTARPAPFSGLTSPTGHARQSSSTVKPALSGGSFFDAKPAPPPKPTALPPQAAPMDNFVGGGDFGDFSSAASPPLPSSSTRSPPAQTSSGSIAGMGDLFGLSSPPISTQSSAPPPPKPATTSPPPISALKYSAFNLSQPAAPKAAPAATQTTSSASTFSTMGNMDAWGSNDAWATADPSPAIQTKPPPSQNSTNTFKAVPAQPAMTQTSAFDSGWGDPEPASLATSGFQPSNSVVDGAFGSAATGVGTSASGFNVQQDEEFGGWSHASPVATTPGPRQGGGGGGTGGSDDLFGNVWN